MYVNQLLSLITAGMLALTSSVGCAAESVQNADTSLTQTVYAEFTAEYTSRDCDPSYDESTATKIVFSDGEITAGSGAEVSGTTVTITDEGTYILSGSSSNAQVVINASDTDKVQLVLAGLDITSCDGPAIYEKESDKTFITLVGENSVSDSENYTVDEDEEPNAAIFAYHDLTINGSGSLTVNGNYRHGILTKDDLKITGGTITVNAVEDGVRGRDSVLIKDGTLSVTAGEDGIKSNNDSGEEKGRISIDGGTVTIVAGNDGIQAESVLQINDGTLDITTGDIENAQSGGGMPDGGMGGGRGGFSRDNDLAQSDAQPSDAPQNDGTQPSGMVQGGMGGGRGGFQGGDPAQNDGTMPSDMPQNDGGMQGGTPQGGGMGGVGRGGMQAQDGTQPSGAPQGGEAMPNDMNNDMMLDGESPTDEESDSKKGIKSGNVVYINGGTISVTSEDDAIHSNVAVTVNGGELNLSSGDDGIHADYYCTVTDGRVVIARSYEGLEGKTVVITGGCIDITASDDGLNAADPESSGMMGMGGSGSSDVYIEITGGTLNVVSGYDSLDSNGDIYIQGGTVVLDGPSSGMDCAIDCDGSAYINGGTVAASGASSGSIAPSSSSEQATVMVLFTSQQSAGTTASILNSNGEIIASVTPSQSYSGVIFSTPYMAVGESYTVVTDTVSVTYEQTSEVVSISDSGEAVTSGMNGGMGGGGRGGDMQGGAADGGQRGMGGGMRQGQDAAPAQ